MAKGMELDSNDALSDDDEDFDEPEGLLHIKVAESVYFDFVFTCSKHTEWLPKATSLFFVGLSIIIQLLLSKVLLGAITSDAVSAKVATSDGNRFEQWRNELDSGGEMSGDHAWAYWACNGQDWSWQQSVIADYQAYTQQVLGISSGRFFGIVAISLWMAFIVREYKDVVTYAQLMTLPECLAGKECYYDEENMKIDKTNLYGLPCWVKFVVLLVAVCRLVICSFLGYYGVQFLAYTESLKDFVLNSIALGFILDIDELVFSVFIEGHKKRFLGGISDVTLQPSRWVVIVQDKYSGMIGFACTVILVCLAYVFVLNTFATNLKFNAYCELCSETGSNTSLICGV